MTLAAIGEVASMTILTARHTWRRESGNEKSFGNRLNRAERDNVRAALVFLRGRYRTVDECVAVLVMTRDALHKGTSRYRAQTYRLACVVARAAGVAVEKVLSGAWPGDRCPHCGGTGKRSQVVSLTGRPKKNGARPI